MAILVCGAPRGRWSVFAQDAAAPPTATPEGGPISIQEVKPSGFYLRNEKGELVYVPDFSYEQFEQLLKVQRNLAQPQRPAFILRAMDITGRAVGSHVELDVAFTLEGRQLEGVAEGTWFRVPLRLDGTFLRGEPVFSGAGQHFVTYEGPQEGYVCWLQAGTGELKQVTLPLLAAIEKMGGESRVALTAPTPLASTMTLRIAEVSAEGAVRDLPGDTSRPLAFEVTPEGDGQFSARGIRGNVVVTWHASDGSGAPSDVRLDVSGTVLVTADELLQEVRSEGRFVVRGLGGPVDRFEVRLPVGMRLRDASGPGYQIRPVAAQEDTLDKGQLVEVRLDRPALGEATVTVSAELPPSQDDPTWPLTVARLVDKSVEFEPARFEFSGAIRHRGYIDFVLNGDWALQWVEDVDFPRVDPGAFAPGAAAVSARFRYYHQRGALRVSIRQKATRIRVEPKYDLHVDARHLRLQASLLCETSGSRAGPLAIRLPGWTVELVQFADGNGTVPVDLAENNPLIVPIPVEAQAAGRFVVRVEARQDLTAGVVSGTSPLRATIPMVEAANPSRVNLVVSPATVSVFPAHNVLLTPLPAQIQALAPLAAPASAGASVSDASPLISAAGASGSEMVLRYRDRGAVEQGVFVADFKIQPQSISVTATATAAMDRFACDVEQRLAYTVLHESVDTLALSVPAELISEQVVQARILCEDQPLVPMIQETSTADRVAVLVRLPRPWLGALELRILHPRRPMPELSSDQATRLVVPLILPSTRLVRHTSVLSNTLAVSHNRQLSVESVDRRWIVEDAESVGGQLMLSGSADTGQAELRVVGQRVDWGAGSVAYQVWVQTWLAANQRRDRVAFRVRTSEDQVRVRLPLDGGSLPQAIRVAVDQREATFLGPDPQGVLTCPLPGTVGNDATEERNGVTEHVVEVWYTLTEPTIRSGRRHWLAPTIDAIDQVDRAYWHLIVPRGEVVIVGDRAMTAEWLWHWSGLGWRRGLLREQADLEQWIGASSQELIPATANQYVFTAFGLPERLEVTTASRSMLVLVLSGVVLAVGGMLMYVPVLRHPAGLLGLGVVVVALGTAFPEPAILLAQAAVAGLALAFLGRIIHMRLWQNAQPGAGRYPLTDSKLMEIRYPRADGSSRAQAGSVPVTAQASQSDLEP